jgi:hypothetical protein
MTMAPSNAAMSGGRRSLELCRRVLLSTILISEGIRERGEE